MNKKVMRPLTEAEMQAINGGGWFTNLVNKVKWFFAHFILSKSSEQTGFEESFCGAGKTTFYTFGIKF